MKEKVLKALWYTWMLLPIGLACFVLPFFPAVIWLAFRFQEWYLLWLSGPLVMAGGVHYFYKKRRFSSLVSLHIAAVNLLVWFFTYSIFASTIARMNYTEDSYGMGCFITGAALPALIIIGHAAIYFLVRKVQENR